MRKVLLTIVILLMVLTCVQIWITQDRTSQQKQLDQASGQTQVEGTPIGGDFTLTDHNGKIVHESDFHGRIMLVFFGFARCPDVCPVTLSVISKAMALLGDKADQVVPIFISIDPEHDTPEVMKNYLSSFDKRMVGLTGTVEQIKDAESSYKVYAAKKQISGQSPSDYTFDHSAYMYIMGKDGKFLTVLPSSASDQEISHEIEHYLSQ